MDEETWAAAKVTRATLFLRWERSLLPPQERAGRGGVRGKEPETVLG
ncbi:Hypothetical protein CAP_3026 [Chondromyces apiculatus DSM 436]|uniref:Uncharacterized protein n=1 Tax=Chondromyces apiculatus DSM 436 TaxID=1192034 RepID=A0A017TAU9_9BACT|nr:Hypothetical protein CAP_3026 [Chondromyces apiculatus DSM 436]